MLDLLARSLASLYGRRKRMHDDDDAGGGGSVVVEKIYWDAILILNERAVMCMYIYCSLLQAHAI